MAFWPDPRGSTPKALAGLFQDKDQAVFSIEDFQSVSIAAKGFYALEFLLFDPQFTQHENQAYHCAFVKAVANDILSHANTLRDDWHSGFADMMRNPTATDVFRNEAEVLQEMFKSLTTGLQFTAESRLGRPLGTFDRPRPNRAEARRSGRSSRHVLLSLLALQDLAGRLAEGNPELSGKLDARFDKALSQVSAINDPTFAGVADPQTRIKVEGIQQSVEAIRTLVRNELGPILGVAVGFNALDGD